MNKMDEVIACTAASIVNNYVPYPICRTLYRHLDVITQERVAKRRGDVENDPNWKQLIPYGIITQESEVSEMSVLTYSRTTAGGESRLHNLRSIGFGGHMRRNESVLDCIKRELNEELKYVDGKWSDVVKDSCLNNFEYFWTINDNSTPVNSVHFGMVMFIEADLDRIVINEDALADIKPLTMSELYTQIDQYEPWSQMLIKEWRDYDYLAQYNKERNK